MGVDVYLKWEGQTEIERKAQVTGFSTVSGHKGYLRSSYRWAEGLAVMQSVFKWNWEDNHCRHFLEQGELQKNLEDSWIKIKKLDKEEADSFRDFIKLAESKLKEDIDVWVYISY